ncbi:MULTISPECIES: septum site-determining protein MinC [unclassified Achromobacter]|uniref:septum site-determining protein MinC n=1 Tax=unclassified Achromobacter TaxID=2626865 RepID=UPI000B517C53|nr:MULTISPECIES: septum site-determining protein MinC [unclassified Achromobacter]OWT75261.1 septum site-determining protein MinC [Achromobacter sp. HZ28]OWT75920.1 septum site-determining protein MinC [Achromobacter sp. HZ34]
MNSATLALDFKSATLYAVRVVLHNADLAQLTAALDKRMADAGSFFENEPVVIDASRVETPVDWAALVTALRGHKLPPIGVVAEGDNLRAALAAGLAAVELSTPPPRAPQQADAGGAPPPMPTQPAADLVAAPEPTATPAEAETAAKVISGTGTAAAGAAPISSAADGKAEVAKEDAAKTNGAGTGAGDKNGGKNGGNGGANAGQRNGKPAEGAGARNGNGGNAAGLPAAPARQPIPERAARSTTSAAAPTATDPQSSSALVITRPLRSGQRVYARHSDLVVIGMVSQGAEVIADGNVHVYGPLRGKAMAGARGDTTARIFTTHLDAELLAVAGVYRVIEDKLDATLHGKPALVRLEGDTLRLEALKS